MEWLKNWHLYLPRFDLMYKRHRRGLQPLKGTELDEIDGILGEYNLKATAVPKALPVAGRSRSLLIDTPIGKVVYKKYKPSLTLPAVVHEHSILGYLVKTGFPTPRPIPALSGETYVHRQEGIYVLFAYLQGYDHYTDYLLLPAQARPFISAAGDTLAVLHERLQGFVPQGHNRNGFKSLTGGRWRGLDWYADKLTHCMVQMGNQNLATDRASIPATMLLERADWIGDELHQLDHTLEAASPPRLIIHGDYTPNNLLFRPNAPPVVLDFEIARLDWRITDLARSISRFAYNRLGFNSAKMKCFLSAYIARYPVAADELRLIPTVWLFLLLRRVIVCCHHGCTTHSDRWDAEIQRHLKRIDWIVANRDRLIAHLEAISEPS